MVIGPKVSNSGASKSVEHEEKTATSDNGLMVNLIRLIHDASSNLNSII